jgi:3-oxoacyl-[acyl-carrier protein] reductase
LSEQPLSGRIALVTGGGGGIGAGISQALAVAGATVIITYNRDEKKAQAVLTALPGDKHRILQMQVERSRQIADVAGILAADFGKLDILVNNAGTTRFVPLDDLDALDDTLIDQIFQVNWRGAFACVRGFRALLDNADEGLIVNITSVAARLGTGSNIAYCASKAAMDTMTVSLAKALAPRIRVVSVAPGLVEGDYARGFDPAWRQAQIDSTPLGRLATPDDVGAAVIAAAVYLRDSTGCIIPVDGGRPIA